MSAIDEAAQRFFENWNTKKPYEVLTGELAICSIADAYHVQSALQKLHVTNRGKIAGRKIALTSQAIQEMVGIDQPISGAIFSEDIHLSPANISLSDFVRLGIEFELAIVLKSDIPPHNDPHTTDSVHDFIKEVRPAFELIEDRGADYSDLDLHTLIADNAWCGGVIIGEPLENWKALDIGNIPCCVIQDGQSDEKTNSGATNPLGSIAWILNHFSKRGITLHEGEVLITGSAVRTRFPVSGDSFTYEMGGATVQLAVD